MITSSSNRGVKCRSRISVSSMVKAIEMPNQPTGVVQSGNHASDCQNEFGQSAESLDLAVFGTGHAAMRVVMSNDHGHKSINRLVAFLSDWLGFRFAAFECCPWKSHSGSCSTRLLQPGWVPFGWK